MQQQTGLPPSPNASSFAGLLAALAEPKSKRVPAWNDDELEDDVATLSYERALQAHARYRPVDEEVPAPQQSASVDSIRDREVNSEEIALRQNAALSNDLPANNPDASPYRAPSSSRERNLKCASITIRLSQLECTQLRTRAAEAGLSVSAYLRSCTFEAEALRAEVKETLAQLRTGESSEKPHPPAPDRRSWFHWRTRHTADKS
jgi:predicted DNA binding CopG/RHH family protein